jgi:CRISPR/Cas system CSM-associated protein Csm4 (group 5 of RAMP superfamily)
MNQDYDALLGSALDALKDREALAQQQAKERVDRILNILGRTHSPRLSHHTLMFIEEDKSIPKMELGREVLGSVMGYSKGIKQAIISNELWDSMGDVAREAIGIILGYRLTIASLEDKGFWWLIDYSNYKHIKSLERAIRVMSDPGSTSEHRPSLSITKPIAKPAKAE